MSTLLSGELKYYVAQIAPLTAYLEEDTGKPSCSISKDAERKAPGFLYKVRIPELHPPSKVPDKDLPWAEDLISNGASGGQVQVERGVLLPYTFVWVRVWDMPGELNDLYQIISVLPNKQCPESGKKPTDDTPIFPQKVETQLIYYKGIPEVKVPYSVIESKGGGVMCSADKYPTTKEDERVLKEDKMKFPTPCKPIDTAAMNEPITKLIKDIQNLKTELTGSDSFLSTSQNFINEVQSRVNSAAETIASGLKWIINFLREEIMKKINIVLNLAGRKLFLHQRFQFNEVKQTTLDLIACLFNRIIDNLVNMIADFLRQIIDRYINAPLCALESFLSNILGQLLGQLTGAINSILSSLSSLIGGAISFINLILDTITNLLDFLTCKVDQKCPTTEEWNLLDGAPSGPRLNLDINGIMQSATNIANTFKGAINPSNFNFNLDFGGAISSAASGCNVGPILCGPPTVSFWGGGGSGASGNPIISATGDILGIDIISPGSGYTKAPFVSIEDSCGKGNRAVATAVVGSTGNNNGNGGTNGTETTGGTNGTGSTTTGVIEVVINDPGFGYLPSPNGDKGGSGRVWADRCQTIVQRADGTWDTPYNPGSVIQIRIGDYVEIPGQLPYTSKIDESITAPQCPPEPELSDTISGSDQYPVTLVIDRVEVADPGYNYSPDDKIVIEGGGAGEGAELNPVFNSNGRLDYVDVINGGFGFTERPRLVIISNTGYNAEMIPVFKVIKGAALNELLSVRRQIKVISVRDCVGVFPNGQD